MCSYENDMTVTCCVRLWPDDDVDNNDPHAPPFPLYNNFRSLSIHFTVRWRGCMFK